MILAAGLGLRMRPLSDHRAKPALPVLGRPVISLLLELLARCGVREVLINLHHLPSSIRDAVEADHPAALDLTWSIEDAPLGTGGGIRRAADFLRGTDDCLVLAGDMLLDLDLPTLCARHRASGRDVTLVLRDDPRTETFGSIGLDAAGRVVRIG
ncbi:MAG: nucleotidyltransferase family protein, partial [Myxococcales bacterium]|nr:nucleotidyltransferase family protein [Myxococcales bacterium]